MSYTPNDQLLQAPLELAEKALDALQNPIRARLADRDKWNEEHLEELETLLMDVVSMQIRFLKLSKQVR